MQQSRICSQIKLAWSYISEVDHNHGYLPDYLPPFIFLQDEVNLSIVFRDCCPLNYGRQHGGLAGRFEIYFKNS